MSGIKLWVAPFAGAVTGLSSVLDDTATRLVLYAGAAAAAGYFWRKFVKPFGELIHRSLTAWKVWDGLPEWHAALAEWRTTVDHRLSAIESVLWDTREPVQAIARELDIQHRETPDPPDPLGASDR